LSTKLTNKLDDQIIPTKKPSASIWWVWHMETGLSYLGAPAPDASHAPKASLNVAEMPLLRGTSASFPL